MGKSKFVIIVAGDSLLTKMNQPELSGTHKPNPFYDKGVYSFIQDMCKGITTREALHLFKKPVYKAKADQKALILAKALETSEQFKMQIAPSEVITLMKLGTSKKEKDKFVILFPDIPQAVFCALVLKTYIENNLALSFEEDLGKGLLLGTHPKEGEKFGIESIFHFTKTLVSYLKPEIINEYQVILDITGCPKWVLPYVTLIANCFKEISIRFLYEPTGDLMTLFPIPVNYNSLQPYYRTLSKVIRTLSTQYRNALFDSLPKKIKNFIYLFPIDLVFDKAQELSKEREEEYTVPKFILNNNELRNDLNLQLHKASKLKNEAIKEELIYPEILAPSLFQMASQFLGSILGNLPEFLSQEEIYILFLGLYAYDLVYYEDATFATLYEKEDETMRKIDISHFSSLIEKKREELIVNTIKKSPNLLGLEKEEKEDYLNAIISSYLYTNQSVETFKLNSGQSIKISTIASIRNILLSLVDISKWLTEAEEYKKELIIKNSVKKLKNRISKLKEAVFYQGKIINQEKTFFNPLTSWFNCIFTIWEILNIDELDKEKKEKIIKTIADLREHISSLKSLFPENMQSSYIKGVSPSNILIQLEKWASTTLLEIDLESRLEFEEEIENFKDTLVDLAKEIWKREILLSDEFKHYNWLLDEWFSTCDSILRLWIAQFNFKRYENIYSLFIKPTEFTPNTTNPSLTVLKLRIGIELKKDASEDNVINILTKVTLKKIKEIIKEVRGNLKNDKGQIIIEGLDIYSFSNLTKSIYSYNFV